MPYPFRRRRPLHHGRGGLSPDAPGFCPFLSTTATFGPVTACDHGGGSGTGQVAGPGFAVAYCWNGAQEPGDRTVSPREGPSRPKFGRIDPFCLMAVLPVLLVAGI